MGTKWRGLLAPENIPTDDGRRFKALSARALPLGLNWQPQQEMGHDKATVVGSLESVNIGTTAEAIEAGWISPEKGKASKLPPDARGAWGAGELFDDVDAEEMPRLAENVAEAKTLIEREVVAVSIDAIPVGAIMLVEPGTDEPISEERMEELWEEAMESGVEPQLEILFEEGMIGGATLVSIPAFSEVRPFELLAMDDCPEGKHRGPDGTCVPDGEMVEESEAASRALVAALTAAAPPLPPADLFADPEFSAYTEIHVVERPDGLLQVQGHYAPHGVCHLGVRDACYTAPLSQAEYVPFHRHVIETDGGELLGVGRITTGFGRVGNSCARGSTSPHCRGKDDHACEDLSMAQAIAHHDQQTTLAWVRAGEDEHGLYVVGVADADLSVEGRKLLEGRKFSGDWREHGTDLELVELLALAHGAPAFPAPRAFMRNGRRASLVASYPPPRTDRPEPGRWPREFARSVADMVVADLRASGLVSPTHSAGLDALGSAVAVTAATEPEHTGAMIALIPSPEDAGRLAVDGGEPEPELHLTLAYLGEAADIDDETQLAIVARMNELVATWTSEGATLPVPGDAFSVSVFNPDADTAVVMGVGGEVVDAVHTDVEAALSEVFTGPDQHAPWVAHVTLAYSDDLSMVQELADRCGPVTFDRLRIAFAGSYTDLPLGIAADGDATADTVTAAIDEAFAALDALAAADRAREAAALLRELEGAGVRV